MRPTSNLISMVMLGNQEFIGAFRKQCINALQAHVNCKANEQRLIIKSKETKYNLLNVGLIKPETLNFVMDTVRGAEAFILFIEMNKMEEIVSIIEEAKNIIGDDASSKRVIVVVHAEVVSNREKNLKDLQQQINSLAKSVSYFVVACEISKPFSIELFNQLLNTKKWRNLQPSIFIYNRAGTVSTNANGEFTNSRRTTVRASMIISNSGGPLTTPPSPRKRSATAPEVCQSSSPKQG